MALSLKKEKRNRRHKRVRAKIFGTADRPRLCVFKSNNHIYCQLVDDEKGKTILSCTDIELKKENLSAKKNSKIEVAKGVGKLIAEKAVIKKIKKIVFDRGGYRYQGKVKALAEGAREGGLEF